MLTLADLGILRDVDEPTASAWSSTITPTYSGCPAMREIAHDLRAPRSPRPASPRSTCGPRSRPPGPPTGSPTRAAASWPTAGIAPPHAAPAPRRAGAAHPRPDPSRRSPARGAARRTPTRTAEFGATACKALYRCAELPRAVRARQGDLMRVPRTPTEFHPLTVARVEPLTDDSVAVTFDVPDELAEDFALRARAVADDRGRRRASAGPTRSARRGAARRASACARCRAAPSPAGWCTRSGPAT